MSRTTPLPRLSRAAAAAALLICLTAAPATARPDPGEPATVQSPVSAQNCPLRRVGTQLVRCDFLTGNGFTAPLSIPEL